MIDVIWLAREDVCSRCRMDEWIIEDLLNGAQKTGIPCEHEVLHFLYGSRRDKAIVVLPAFGHVEHVDWVNEQIGWVTDLTLILTSDEGQHFPVDQLKHDNMKLWVQTPRPEASYPPDTVFFGVGSGRAWQHVHPRDRDIYLYFAGQRTHDRRQDAITHAARVPNAVVNPTDGFMQGVDREMYLERMMSARFAPAPSGPETQDSFRFYEALECGAYVIHDGLRPDGHGRGYWDMVAPNFPTGPIEQWVDLPSVVQHSYPSAQLLQHAWWHQRRRQLGRSLAAASGVALTEDLTVVIPTSPVHTHPATNLIAETIDSIRARTDAEILVTADGVRNEQRSYTDDYHEYLHRVCQLAEHEWWNVTPYVNTLHLHQARMLQLALDEVDTEFFMYVEHDTPLVNDIDMDHVLHVMRSNKLNLMRFYHEAHIQEGHEHLMAGPVQPGGWMPTMQWSQRPHIARTSWYRQLLHNVFAPEARTMIEDVMFGICEHAWLVLGPAAWNDWRLAIWHPAGDTIQRSTHLDGRGPDPKFEDRFQYRYPGGVEGRPAGSPHPQVGA